MAAIGLIITIASTGLAVALDRRNEHSLLQVQTRQAAAVLSATVLRISQPLTAAAAIAKATSGDEAAFAESIGAETGPGRLFVSAALVEVRDGTQREITSAGLAPMLGPGAAARGSFVRDALSSRTFVVTGAGDGPVSRVAYAVASTGAPRYVVYAERAIPADRRVPVESDSAFSDLHFATYLGTDTTVANLATTDLNPAARPLSGDTARETIPFGNTVITLVTVASRPLGGELGRQLPWVFLAGGLLLTGLAASWTTQLIRRRQAAEQDAATIQGLYAQLDGLYAEQRGIAETLQRALLPRVNPVIPGLESAARYVAGARDMDVGGDWYSMLVIDHDHVAFVLGDVSGRGLSAATVMARLRFTIRAYLLEGHAPDVVMQMCSGQLDIIDDGHFATVLIGMVDLTTREVTLVNAGHPEPLVVTAGEVTYARTEVGPPIGTCAATYLSTTFRMEPGSTLLAFTDGLVERRGELLDIGLERLAAAARSATAADSLDGMLSSVLAQMAQDTSEDDTALLAFRWRA